MPRNEQHRSSNTSRPQFARSVFSNHAHTGMCFSSVTTVFVPGDPFAPIPVGSRLNTHRVESDLPPLPPRRAPQHPKGKSPASARPQRQSIHNQQQSTPQAVSLHEQLSVPVRHPVLHQGEGVSPHQNAPSEPQEPRGPIQRPLRGVRQDKARFASARRESPQPAVVTKGGRAKQTDNVVIRTQKDHDRAKPKAVQVTVWVSPVIKAELVRLATQEGLSVSATGAAFLERALQRNIDLEYSALLKPIIEQTIAHEMRGIATRLVWLLVRISFDAGQTRSMVTNILGRQPGMSQDLLKTILVESGKTAKSNITRRTPQIRELVEAVEKWLVAEDPAEREKCT